MSTINLFYFYFSIDALLPRPRQRAMEDGPRGDSKEAGTLLRDLYLRPLAGDFDLKFVVCDMPKCCFRA